MFKNLNSNTYKKVGTLSNVPNNVSYLSTKPNENIDKVTIGIKYNKDIQHISIENYKAKEYYENYFMTLSYSDDIQNLQHAQLKKLLDLSRKYTNDCDLSFIEIGCGDGDFLLKASNIFKNTVGVEPSEKFSNFAKNRGLSIINKYINSEEKGGVIGSEKFNAFASRQVFEHLEDPLNVLLGIKKNLKKNAVGLIEVPNGANSYRSGRFYDFFPDHINYYSINSIVSLATSAGFNVLSCNEALNGDYI